MGRGMGPSGASLSALSVFKPGVARWWLNRCANAALLFRLYPRAMNAYRKILRIDPTDKYARCVLGNLYAKTGDRAAAIREFEALVASHPQDADGWFNLGFLHDLRDELEDAEHAFRQALELSPALDRAWYGLGLMLIRQRRLEEAVIALMRNIKLQPFSPYGYYQLGMTYHHLGHSDKAWHMYEELTRFEPRYAATLKRDLECTAPQAACGRPDSKAMDRPSATADLIKQ